MAPGVAAEVLDDLVVQRLRVLRQRTERAQFAEQHHLGPGKARHQNIDAVPHGLDVAVQGGNVHLDAGDGERRHTVSLLQFGPISRTAQT